MKRKREVELRFGYIGQSMFDVEITSKHLGIRFRIKQRKLMERIGKRSHQCINGR